MNLNFWPFKPPAPAVRLRRELARAKHSMLDAEAELIYNQARLRALRVWNSKLEAQIKQLEEENRNV